MATTQPTTLAVVPSTASPLAMSSATLVSTMLSQNGSFL